MLNTLVPNFFNDIFQLTKLRNNEWQNEMSVVECKSRGRNRPSNLRHRSNIYLKILNKIMRNQSKNIQHPSTEVSLRSLEYEKGIQTHARHSN